MCAAVRRLAAGADMLHEIAEWDSFGDFERALHFVHGFETADALRIGNRDREAALRGRARDRAGGRVKRMQREAVFFERIGQLANGLRISRN